jgi:hypothetical protein
VIVNGLQLDLPAHGRRIAADQIAAFGWGLFFIWIGAAFLADIGWPACVLGVGLIAIGVQVARVYLGGQRIEAFVLAMGIAMVAWGGWQMVGGLFGLARIPGGLMPVVFIALGVTLVVRALLRRNASQEQRP